MAHLTGNKGVLIAILLITAWLGSLLFLLSWNYSWYSPFTYFLVLVQMHLYTGLFITAHDAMHGTVSSNSKVNRFVGQLCTALYALFPFRKLYTKHHLHHQHVHTASDPDYHEGGFIKWYLNFILEYITWWQMILMAIAFNVLKIWFSEINLILFWVIPSLLSTLQLFYFGTWLPHHGEHDNKHQSGTQRRNHLLAFLSCYFFGYHYEHHDSPGIPWWRLWTVKES
jgi:beta-carotene/zeaxanthin 4-ketolase